MKPKVYVETSVVGYLTAWPSRDLVRAAHQQLTREWWDQQRENYELFVSEAVLQEAGAGDTDAARERLEVLQEISELEITDEAKSLAKRLVSDVPLPEKAKLDALHIATAIVHGIDYLLTWNCRHIANATLRGRIEAVCHAAGYQSPIFCTPEELLEDIA